MVGEKTLSIMYCLRAMGMLPICTRAFRDAGLAGLVDVAGEGRPNLVSGFVTAIN